MKTICVYCGSSAGKRSGYSKSAEQLGRELAKRGSVLVYGGSNIGLMGTLANAALSEGGQVVGVLPKALDKKEVAHPGLTELQVVKDMHERKAKMAALSDAFIAMPGGFGTLDEMMEMITWNQLGFQAKPIGFLNVEGYFDDLFRFLGHAARQGFVQDSLVNCLVLQADPVKLLDQLGSAKWPDLGNWPQTSR